MNRRVRQITVPDKARALSTLPGIDYADAFVVEVGASHGRTAEQWARAVLEDAPTRVRRTLQSGWLAIGLRLGLGRSNQLVLGWEVRRSAPDFVLLVASSRVGLRAQLLFKRQRHTLLFCTFVQQENQMARALWAGVELAHVPVVRSVLEQASQRITP